MQWCECCIVQIARADIARVEKNKGIEELLAKIEIFKKTKASVFQKLSIFELSVLILLGQWDRLADYYVDYSGKMTKSEIIHLLRKSTLIYSRNSLILKIHSLKDKSTLNYILQ